jgi:hypothetical protein
MKTVDIADHDAEGSAAKSYNWYKEMILASENPKAGVPMDFYPAIMCLKDKGILLGSSGESKWYDPISRAEALALFERLAKVSGGDTSGGGSSDPDDQVTHINVLPGVNVEVGEEVYFDGAFYQNEYDPSVQWEWDFGDGYTLKAGAPSASTFDTGLW